jgi:hypothetical protein
MIKHDMQSWNSPYSLLVVLFVIILNIGIEEGFALKRSQLVLL